MTEPRTAEPVDPDRLLQAFLILADGAVPDDSNEPVRMTEGDAGRLLAGSPMSAGHRQRWLLTYSGAPARWRISFRCRATGN